MKKVLKWVAVVALASVLVVVVGRNWIARKAVEIGVRGVTGFPLEIGAVDVGLFNGRLAVSDLKLMNPPGDFEEPMFVDLPEFRMHYRLRSFLAGHPHIKELTIHLDEVVIVKNAKGESNVQRLKGVAGDTGESSSAPPADKSSPKFQLDVVHLRIGVVKVKDYSKGRLVERTYPLHLNATYKDIRSSADVTRLALVTMMSKVPLPDMGIKLEDLQKRLSQVGTAAGEAVKGVTEAGQGLFDKLKPK
jgi:hypothetical protein